MLVAQSAKPKTKGSKMATKRGTKAITSVRLQLARPGGVLVVEPGGSVELSASELNHLDRQIDAGRIQLGAKPKRKTAAKGGVGAS